ncbi:MAG: PEP-CTERM sorting domain-containing protein [Desulfuromonadaceae bacterium]|nr:PEP-CTERM sorting domain-containing protein [Desulfuromonadaceae bacterium]MDD5106958.1 PEP-CTERM sorting domain-containing protein [Desulfuromonadaceae bacterium]
MKTYVKTFLTAAALVGAVAGPAFSTVVIEDSARRLYIDTEYYGGSSVLISENNPGVFDQIAARDYPSSPFTFNYRPVSASQSSTISTSSIFGSGEAKVGFSFEGNTNTFAESYFMVLFNLDKAYDFTLTGALSKNIDGGYGQAYLRLAPGWGSDIYNYNTDNGNQILNHSGILNAGSYSLSLWALVNQGSEGEGSYYGGTSSFEFGLDLTEVNGGTGTNPVPEPSTMLLLGGGLAGLAFWRRKKNV